MILVMDVPASRKVKKVWGLLYETVTGGKMKVRSWSKKEYAREANTRLGSAIRFIHSFIRSFIQNQS